VELFVPAARDYRAGLIIALASVARDDDPGRIVTIAASRL